MEDDSKTTGTNEPTASTSENVAAAAAVTDTSSKPKVEEDTAMATETSGENLISLTIKTPKEKETVSVKPDSTIKEV